LFPRPGYTENTAEIHVGEGLWVGASEAPTTFKIYAVGLASQQVGFYGVMKEWDKPLVITEIERVLARNIRTDRMQNLITPRPDLVADVSPLADR
jgi:hypothetical protein